MPKRSGLRVAVLQPGARLHYAVPAVLQRAGMLHRLYTDCANAGLLRGLERVWPVQLQPAPVRRLLGRKLPPEISISDVRQVRAAVARELLFKPFVGAKAKRTPSRALMDLALKERFGRANTIYTVLVNEDLELCREARRQGRYIVHEVMLTPDVGLLIHDEYRRYARIEGLPQLGDIHAGRERDRKKYELSDLILVPSPFVREAALALGAEPSKVALVPYGIDRRWLTVPSNPIEGRVLFVGSVGLRKGCHVLANATRRLAAHRVKCDVRIVGPFEPEVAGNPIFDGPTYLGQVPRSDIHREYSQADIFVLPSFAEGMAIATLEAMAVGLPVITTFNSGSCVRDGLDGFIIPAGDANALALAIERIITDRDLRARMSRNAKSRAGEFTWEKYGSRLIGALGNLDMRAR